MQYSSSTWSRDDFLDDLRLTTGVALLNENKFASPFFSKRPEMPSERLTFGLFTVISTNSLPEAESDNLKLYKHQNNIPTFC
jgi:hypothetical protein